MNELVNSLVQYNELTGDFIGTWWFRKGVICSGIFIIAFYLSLKVVLLDIQNSKGYNFIHIDRLYQKAYNYE